ncbi:MAG TPA: hypothetical protein VNA19_00235 [Pyrinomonadaceae bacterium]|nr:hypothetical protein [Pyrinomonadaceae bacterium]
MNNADAWESFRPDAPDERAVYPEHHAGSVVRVRMFRWSLITSETFVRALPGAFVPRPVVICWRRIRSCF